jgi:hypothetical protein
MRRFQLLSVCVAVLLAGCGSGPSPLVSDPLRRGADQSAVAMKSLPPPPRAGQYDPSVAPENEEKGQKVGEVVAKTGGQKTQQEKEKEERAAVEKEQARQRAEQARQLSSEERKTTQ